MYEYGLARRRLLLGAAATLVSSTRSWAYAASPAARHAVSPAGEVAASNVAAAHVQIAAIERRVGGRLGVAALNTGTQARIAYRTDERFPMCSTFKLPLVALILSRVDAGKERLDRFVTYRDDPRISYAPITRQHMAEGGMSVEALCAAAICYSDNIAANVLLESVAGPPALTAYFRRLGDRDSRLDRNEPALNSAITRDPRDTTKPAAMVETLRKLLLGTVLSADSRKQLIDWLIANTTGDHRLRAGLPTDWRIGDKTGTGEHGATNDVAILWPAPAQAPILITAYLVGSTAHSTDLDAAQADVGRIVAAAFATTS